MSSGGFRIGAGRPGRDLKVEDCRRLDARKLQSAGLFLQPWAGFWFWSDQKTGTKKASINIVTAQSSIQLKYSCNKRVVMDFIQLEKVKCGFGGVRFIFICPDCSRTATVFLFKNGLFRCRCCQNLRYESQSDNAIGRLWSAQILIENKLGSNKARPKGMHDKTYRRLRLKIFELEYLRDNLLDELIKLSSAPQNMYHHKKRVGVNLN